MHPAQSEEAQRLGRVHVHWTYVIEYLVTAQTSQAKAEGGYDWSFAERVYRSQAAHEHVDGRTEEFGEEANGVRAFVHKDVFLVFRFFHGSRF